MFGQENVWQGNVWAGECFSGAEMLGGGKVASRQTRHYEEGGEFDLGSWRSRNERPWWRGGVAFVNLSRPRSAMQPHAVRART